MPLTHTHVCTLNLFRGSGVAGPETHLNEGENTEQNPRAHPVTQPALVELQRVLQRPGPLHSSGITIFRRKKLSFPKLPPCHQQKTQMSLPSAGHTDLQPHPCNPRLPNCFSYSIPQLLRATGGSQSHLAPLLKMPSTEGLILYLHPLDLCPATHWQHRHS